MLLEKPKKKPLFEDEYKDVMPSDDEMLFLKKQNVKCAYFYKGMKQCRDAINQQYIKDPNSTDEQGYLQCLGVTDAYYTCITNKKFNSLKQIDSRHKEYLLNFTKCYFDEQKMIGCCRRFLDDILRFEFRSSDSPMKKLSQIIQYYI